MMKCPPKQIPMPINARNKIIGILIQDKEFDNFKKLNQSEFTHLSAKGYSSHLATKIRRKWLWKLYKDENMMHPDYASYCWLIEIQNFINKEKIDKEVFKSNFPEVFI